MWRNTWALLVGKQNGATALENGIKIPQKITVRMIMWSSNACFTLCMSVHTYMKEFKIGFQRNNSTHMLIEELLERLKMWEQTKCV